MKMKKETAIALSVAVVTLLLGQGLFLKFYFAPRLSYDILPVHRIGNHETHSFLIKNAGRTRLRNVVMTFQSSTSIDRLRLDGPEITDPTAERFITGGKLGERRLQISVPRMIRGSVYTITLQVAPQSKVTLTAASDETSGTRTTPDTGAGITLFVGFVASILASLSAGLLSYRTRTLVTRRFCRAKRRESGLHLKDTVDAAVRAVSSVLECSGNTGNQPAVSQEEFQRRRQIAAAALQALQDFAALVEVEGVCLTLKDEPAEQEDSPDCLQRAERTSSRG